MTELITMISSSPIPLIIVASMSVCGRGVSCRYAADVAAYNYNRQLLTIEKMVSSISGDTLKKAMEELKEDPETRMEMIQNLRTELEQWSPNPDDPLEQGTSLSRIDDDKFLLCFLRARKFDITRATKLFVNYFKYRHKYASMLGELTPEAVKPALSQNIISILPHRTNNGSKILMAHFGKVNFDELIMEDLMKAMVILLDHMIKDEETQVHGIAFCEDLDGMSFLDMMKLVSKEQMVKGVMFELIQDAFPARFKEFHILNQPWYISVLMTIARPFMKQKTKDRMQMHGSDYSTLYEYISPEHLPVEYGGQLDHLETYSAYHFNF